MRRLGTALVTSAFLAALVGCGDDAGPAGSAGSDDAGSATSGPPTAEGTAPADRAPPAGEWRLVEIVHDTAAGGTSSTVLTPLETADDVAGFTEQFSRTRLREQIERLVATEPAAEGMVLAAAVVSVGCDVPPGVRYADGEVVPEKPTAPLQECLAPVTSVAVVEVPAAEVGEPEEPGGSEALRAPGS